MWTIALSGIPELSWKVLSRGGGSQLIMSIPHGALSFAATELCHTDIMYVYKLLVHMVLCWLCVIVCEAAAGSFGAQFNAAEPSCTWSAQPAQDFMSSSLSTFVCSVVSTPQVYPCTDQCRCFLHYTLLKLDFVLLSRWVSV